MSTRVNMERGLLVVIIILQVVHIGVDLWRDRPPASPEADREPVAAAVSESMGPGRVEGGTALHPVDAMNVMMAQAVRDLERMSSMVIREERWRELGAEPTLDMRERERDYLVAVGLPAYVDPALLVVDLEGRLLTVTAHRQQANPFLAPVKVFERCVQLPGPVAHEPDPTATVSNGLLRVCLPKASPSQPVPPPSRRRLF